MKLDYRPVDADNHYYEALDAFTRHQPAEFRRRGVQVLRDGKRVHIVVADRLNRFIPNPTFDPVIVPGSFGSDWPHGEGLAEPAQFTKELDGFSGEDVHKIMRDNAGEFLGSRAAPSD
jgi:hypothetical protein